LTTLNHHPCACSGFKVIRGDAASKRKNTLANNAAAAYQKRMSRNAAKYWPVDDRSNEMLAIGLLGRIDASVDQIQPSRFDLSLNSPSLSLFN